VRERATLRLRAAWIDLSFEKATRCFIKWKSRTECFHREPARRHNAERHILAPASVSFAGSPMEEFWSDIIGSAVVVLFIAAWLLELSLNLTRSE